MPVTRDAVAVTAAFLALHVQLPLAMVSGAPLQEPVVWKSANGTLDKVLRVKTGRVDAGNFSFNSRLYEGQAVGPTWVLEEGDTVYMRLVQRARAVYHRRT